MQKINLPWKNSHIKAIFGYRNWEALKLARSKKMREKLQKDLESKNEVLFIHIPKTAGVSLITAYGEHLDGARHCPLLLYSLVLGRDIRNYTSFAIIRNPWARLFSAYNFLLDGGFGGTDPAVGRILKNECPTFEKFLKEWLPTNGVYSYAHFVPQYEFVCGWKGNLVVNEIIKLEQLTSEWPKFVEKYNLPVYEIPWKNASSKIKYTDHYDNESIDIVGKLYKKDICIFDYSYNTS